MPPQTGRTRAWASRLAAELPELEVVAPETPEEAGRELPLAEAVLGSLGPEDLARASRLRWLQAPMAGPPAGYYHPALVAHPVVVTNFRGIFNEHLATHAMAFLLAFARGLQVAIPNQVAGQWRPPPLDEGVVHLPESTVLVVGLGGAGAEIARLASAFGMRVLAVDARLRDRPPEVAVLEGPEGLDQLLPEADFVVLTVPHTPATEGLMNRARFERMKRSAFFINVGRGATTRLDDLVDALDAGVIAGAGLDVYEVEPLPAGHALWNHPGVILTPHTAGYGPHLDERRFEIILDNCRRVLDGRPLRNVVDKAAWF